jgi:hypothetical protein
MVDGVFFGLVTKPSGPASGKTVRLIPPLDMAFWPRLPCAIGSCCA